MDQEIFEYITNTLYRFWHNLGSFWSDHGFELLTIFVIAWIVKKFGVQFISRIFHSTIRDDLYPTKGDRIKRLETIDSITGAILRIGVYLVGGVMVISELGVNTTPIIASAGVLGIALGFGAQSLIKDFTSGVFIIIDNQYRVGDVVKLGDVTGVVEAITIRTTVLRNQAGIVFHIPNGSVDTTANLTMGYGGIDEDIVFNYDVDIAKLTMVINKTGVDMAADPKFAQKIIQPPHFERVVGFETIGIKVKILATTTTGDTWEVRGEFYRRFIIQLRKAKIDIPSVQPVLQPARLAKVKA